MRKGRVCWDLSPCALSRNFIRGAQPTRSWGMAGDHHPARPRARRATGSIEQKPTPRPPPHGSPRPRPPLPILRHIEKAACLQKPSFSHALGQSREASVLWGLGWRPQDVFNQFPTQSGRGSSPRIIRSNRCWHGFLSSALPALCYPWILGALRRGARPKDGALGFPLSSLCPSKEVYRASRAQINTHNINILHGPVNSRLDQFPLNKPNPKCPTSTGSDRSPLRGTCGLLFCASSRSGRSLGRTTVKTQRSPRRGRRTSWLSLSPLGSIC